MGSSKFSELPGGRESGEVSIVESGWWDQQANF
ncbi:hypothetical protein, partial [Plasmodium yoelii yoelii]